MSDMTDDTTGDPQDDAPGPLDDLMPRDPIMVAAWLGSLQFVLTRKDRLEAFRRDTGIAWRPLKNGLDATIDGTSGADLALARAFVKWHNETIWGEDEEGGPGDLVDGEFNGRPR